MCIICNVNSASGAFHAVAYLDSFDEARSAMRKASDALLLTADHCANAEDRKRYRTIHKRLVRLRREWARIEHQRERK